LFDNFLSEAQKSKIEPYNLGLESIVDKLLSHEFRAIKLPFFCYEEYEILLGGNVDNLIIFLKVDVIDCGLKVTVRL